jgi:hypothetical protein
VSVDVTAPSPPPNQPPTVAKAASASPNPVTGKTTTLSALGADDGGAANLRYTWSVVSIPSGAALPTFSVNGSNAAANTVATFSKAGSYLFRVTITDASGLSVSSQVSVTVQQKINSITVTPSSATVKRRASQQFVATAFDQFGDALTVQPTFAWSLSGRGSLSSKGLYTAPRRTGGPYTVSASAGGFKGTAQITVVA